VLLNETVLNTVTRLLDGRSGIRSPAEVRAFRVLRNVQNNFGVYPPSYSRGNEGSLHHDRRVMLTAHFI